jgi:hypothetical protein|tara:strand:- start:453 stop:980 length:528 start_codon:yes stop_codon:yes gene_type:complete
MKLKIFFLIFFSINGLTMIIDNLDDTRGRWDAISDNVMGGISVVNFYEVEEGDDRFYRLAGTVSTKNRGGFIQSRVRPNVSAENLKGIRVKVRGISDGYYLWINTSQGRLPWDRYSILLDVTEEWSVIEIPFSDFKKSNFYMPRKMNQSTIRSIAFAAYGKDFEAQLDIALLEFY